MPNTLIFRPHQYKHGMVLRKMQGGAIILSKGGSGGASSYASVNEYEHTTNKDIPGYRPLLSGSGLRELDQKLSKLQLGHMKRKMHKNISF